MSSEQGVCSAGDVHADAIAALGVSSRRIEALRLLTHRQEVSTADVMGESGLSRGGALKYLRELKCAGLVESRTQTHPRGSGPITYWQADRVRLEDALISLVDHVVAQAAV